jgi:flagellin
MNFDASITMSLATATTLGSKTFVLSAVSNALSFQIGANDGQRVNVAFGDLRADNLGFVGDTQPSGNNRTVAGINITTLTGAEEALEIVDEAINQINAQRSALGAFTNRLEATISNLGVASENLTASESRIRDADFAYETMVFTRNQILLQAGVNILAQANLQPQNVLALLG